MLGRRKRETQLIVITEKAHRESATKLLYYCMVNEPYLTQASNELQANGQNL